MAALIVSHCLRCDLRSDVCGGNCAQTPVLPEPAAHARGMVHPNPVPGCPWCPLVLGPCGAADAGSETTWREQAARPGRWS